MVTEKERKEIECLLVEGERVKQEGRRVSVELTKQFNLQEQYKSYSDYR